MSETIMKDKEMKTSIPTLDIDFDQYEPSNIDVWEEYVPISNEKERLTMAIMSANIPYPIESEKGQGKTLLTHTICRDNNIALVNEPIGVGTKKSDLIGSKEINKDGTFFSLGLLPRAIEVANHFGHACLYETRVVTKTMRFNSYGTPYVTVDVVLLPMVSIIN